MLYFAGVCSEVAEEGAGFRAQRPVTQRHRQDHAPRAHRTHQRRHRTCITQNNATQHPELHSITDYPFTFEFSCNTQSW